MGRKVWIDSERLPPEEYDVWCSTPGFAIQFLNNHWGRIEHISIDRGMKGETNLTGEDVISYITNRVNTDQFELSFSITIHAGFLTF